jgi:hypothetical protein
MIYFTTFILTLLLSHIARATPACGDVASPEELYDPTYADAADGQHVFPPIILHNVTWATKYDNKTGSPKSGACPKLARQYPHYKDFHDFPYIGGAWNVKPDNQYCGTCWNLTDPKSKKTISLVVLDSAKTDYYNISKEAFNKLNGGLVGSTWLLAYAKQVPLHFCKIPK